MIIVYECMLFCFVLLNYGLFFCVIIIDDIIEIFFLNSGLSDDDFV